MCSTRRRANAGAAQLIPRFVSTPRRITCCAATCNEPQFATATARNQAGRQQQPPQHRLRLLRHAATARPPSPPRRFRPNENGVTFTGTGPPRLARHALAFGWDPAVAPRLRRIETIFNATAYDRCTKADYARWSSAWRCSRRRVGNIDTFSLYAGAHEPCKRPAGSPLPSASADFLRPV